MFRSILTAVALSAATFPNLGSADSQEDLTAFVSQLPRDSTLGLPMYWMEMESIIGWEEMMLVFGYANNKPVCDLLVRVATADAPNRKFRCVEAN